MRRSLLDPSTADRLLAGAIAPEDAPPEYADVARLIRAAKAAPLPTELAGEARTVAAMAAALNERSVSLTPARSKRPSRMFFRMKVAAVVLAGTMAAGTGLAFAGALPAPAQSAVSHFLATFGVTVPDPNAHAGNHPNEHARDHSGHARDHSSGSAPTGPEATGSARSGLCSAFPGGQGGANGRKSDSVAFQNLQKAAAAAGQSVEQFCTGATPHEQASAGAPVPTPDPGGTGTANTASGGASEKGTNTGDSLSQGHSSAGSATGIGPRAGPGDDPDPGSHEKP